MIQLPDAKELSVGNSIWIALIAHDLDSVRAASGRMEFERGTESHAHNAEAYLRLVD